MLTKRQKLVLLLAWLGWVFDVMDASLFAFTKQRALTEILGAEGYKLLGPVWEGRIQTGFFIGWAIGGLIFGFLADRWARAKTLLTTILLYCVFTGLTGLCQTPEQLWIARFITALGIGGEWAAGAAMVAENVPDGYRAKAAAFLQTAAAVGPFLGAIFNLALAPFSWRWMFLVGVLPAILCAFLRWHVKAEQQKRASESMPRQNPLSELLHERTARRNLAVAVVIGTVGVTGAGVAPFWLPNLVAAATVDPTQVTARVSYATMAMHLGTLAGVFVFPALCQRIGRRLAFGIFFLAAPIVTYLAIGSAPDFQRILICFPLVSFVCIGLSSGFGLYFPELFSARFRATGSGMAYNSGRIMAAPFQSYMGGLVASAGISHAFVTAALIYFVGLAVLPFAPETKGKPLPQ